MSVAEVPVDGRRLRAVRTRARILEALLELLDEGQPEPTASEIAERAGVALRSIAQHFKTREQLLAALAQTHLARLPSTEPAASSGSFAERLVGFVAARTRALEASVSIRHIGRTAEGRFEAISSAFKEVGKSRRKELQRVFGVELGNRDAWVLEAADATSSGAYWDVLRRTQGLSVKRASAVVTETLRALLEG
jgi:TetR/AcrR family transcriptional regulator, regulator of autoinduction and epiphytic fitness